MHISPANHISNLKRYARSPQLLDDAYALMAEHDTRFPVMAVGTTLLKVSNSEHTRIEPAPTNPECVIRTSTSSAPRARVVLCFEIFPSGPPLNTVKVCDIVESCWVMLGFAPAASVYILQSGQSGDAMLRLTWSLHYMHVKAA